MHSSTKHLIPVILAAILATTLVYIQPHLPKFDLAADKLRTLTSLVTKPALAVPKMAKRTPVYFVSHGGPTTMYDTQHPVYAQLQSLGREITQKVRPKAIVVVSAHWQAMQSGTVEINFSESEPLLYDFYGFPKHYYMEKYPNKGSRELAGRIKELITAEKGKDGKVFKVVEEERGLDHGVFVPFKIMFAPETNPVTVPIVQVSLLEDELDVGGHFRLGRALQKLREEEICVVMSGMAVHNLRDFMMARMGQGGMEQALPYAVSFDKALKEAVERAPGEERDAEMRNLLKRSDARRAHPTFEHLLPIHVGVGAAGEDLGRQLWTKPEGSMSWAQYRFGEVEG